MSGLQPTLLESSGFSEQQVHHPIFVPSPELFLFEPVRIPHTFTATSFLPTPPKPRIPDAFVIDRVFISQSVDAIQEDHHVRLENSSVLAGFQAPQPVITLPPPSQAPEIFTFRHTDIVQDRQPVLFQPEPLFWPIEHDLELDISFSDLDIQLVDNVINSTNYDVEAHLTTTDTNLVSAEVNQTSSSTESLLKNITQTNFLNTTEVPIDKYFADANLTESDVLTPFSINFNAEENATTNYINGSVLKSKLCGFPPFCGNSAFEICQNTPLNICEECGMVSAAFIGTFLCILGLLILLGNLLVIWNVVRKKKGFSDKYNKIKASLAVADLLTAVQIFAIAIPNFAWTLGVTSAELDFQQLELRGSLSSYAGGIFNIFTIVLSLFHLLLMGQQRLYAIRWPIKYKATKNDSPILGISLVWGFSLLLSSAPAFLNNFFTYTYYPTLFLYLPAFKDHQLGEKDFTEGIIIAFFLYVFPYFVMTALLLTAWHYGRKYIKQSRNLSHHPSSGNNKNGKDPGRKECALLRTLLLLQLAFTLTVLPQFISMVLFYAGVFTCDTFSVPYFIAFSFGMANGFGNVLVYSIRDPKFRKSFKYVCVKCWFKTLKKESPDQEQNQVQDHSNHSNTSTQTKKSWIANWGQHLRRKSTPNIQV